MSSVTIEWITLAIFVLCFIGAIVAETLWLIRKGWAVPPRAVAFVMITDTLSLSIGFFVPFVIIGAMLAIAFGGGLTDVSGNDPRLWLALIFAFLFPPVFLFPVRRVFLAFFKIRAGKDAWLYALAASLLSMALSFVPPAIFFYAASKLF